VTLTAVLFAALLQQAGAGGWVAVTARPTVGDTVWLERLVPAAPGWRVRAVKLDAPPPPGTLTEPLGDPVTLRLAGRGGGGGWLVRYPVVAWAPGVITADMPPLWRLGPDGSADSLPGGTATFRVASVIPDTLSAPAPQPALAPLRLARRTPLPALAGLLLSAGALVALVAWRRRPPRAVEPGPDLELDPEITDARWVAAGEPRAVAARAAQRLRRAVAHAVPDAHAALTTTECLAVVERARPDAPLRQLRELLHALDQVAFATAHGVDVGLLAARARALAEELEA
jgi:hypothetical protein